MKHPPACINKDDKGNYSILLADGEVIALEVEPPDAMNTAEDTGLNTVEKLNTDFS